MINVEYCERWKGEGSSEENSDERLLEFVKEIYKKMRWSNRDGNVMNKIKGKTEWGRKKVKSMGYI